MQISFYNYINISSKCNPVRFFISSIRRVRVFLFFCLRLAPEFANNIEDALKIPFVLIKVLKILFLFGRFQIPMFLVK